MQANEAVKYKEGSFQPVIDECNGCERIVEVESEKYCKIYLYPAAKWHLGICNFATHAKPEINLVKVRVNPLKASKRASRRKK
ncbi:MAG: PxxKW family cysteine-rich protein [Desulfobulbaceae bacterium]|nr:PxxKW family cysteine-rich protein [Desulfobulbaceae bacterium]